jgi:Rod binding domain-containing protein
MLNIDNSLSLYSVQDTPTIDKKLSKDDQALKEQTDKFEAIFVKHLLDIALKNENPLFPKDPGDKIYNSMFNDAVSKEMSGSFGFSELLFNYLKENR